MKVPVSAGDSAAAATDFAWINSLRVAAGVPAVQIQPWAESEAQSWSTAMANSGVLSHDMAGYMAQGRSALNAAFLGQNVGMGTTLDYTQTLLQASPPHMAILMDPRYNYVGVGVATDSQGQVWLAEDFAEINGAAPAAAPAPKPVAPAPKPVAPAPKPVAPVAPAPRPVAVAKPAPVPALVPAAVTSPFPVPSVVPAPVAPQPQVPAPAPATKTHSASSAVGALKLADHKTTADTATALLWVGLMSVGILFALGVGYRVTRFLPGR